MNKLFFITLVGSALVAEIIFFSYWYFFGNNGYKKIYELYQLQETSNTALTDLRNQVRDLEKKVNDIKTYPYYKEKIVREQLQMMRDNEVIYKRP